ncbi:unnamed protein product [Durusdinium trenchii]|uniref:Uncharacterized protein n=1 Tax=Durusdinium trenchii TaxID=1381693 RepID=A0ABP0IYB9_9DINO
MASGSSQRPPTAPAAQAQCPSGYPRTIRLGPTISGSPLVARTTAPEVAAPDSSQLESVAVPQRRLVAAGPCRSTIPVTVSRAQPSAPAVCRAGQTPEGTSVASRARVTAEGAQTARAVQATTQSTPVWRRVAPASTAHLSARGRSARGATAAYPGPQGFRPWASASTLPQEAAEGGWQSLLQAARERSRTNRASASLQGQAAATQNSTSRASSMMSASALRALEAMVQDVDDFGSEEGACSICLGAAHPVRNVAMQPMWPNFACPSRHAVTLVKWYQSTFRSIAAPTSGSLSRSIESNLPRMYVDGILSFNRF